MIHEENNATASVRFAESEAEHAQPCVNQARAPLLAMRYMDDETFRRSLEKVVVAHERLLAKLAE